MAQYIDKSALVAEIERRIKSVNSCPFRTAELGSEKFNEGQLSAYNVMLFFLNTIEVKEVDFSTEIYKYIDEHFNIYDDGNQTLQTKDKKSLIGRVDVENIAKHFFEFGLQAAQKGEGV